MKSDEIVTYEIHVSGRVQGVAFRHFTKLEAESLGLHGWVMNLSNGKVSINIGGPKLMVLKFLDWCHKGPITAQVDQLQYAEIKSISEKDFSIIR